MSMMRRVSLWCLFTGSVFLVHGALGGQCEKVAVPVTSIEASAHRQTTSSLRSPLFEGPGNAVVTLKVTVDETGAVTRVKALRGAAVFFEAAEKLEKGSRFSLFVQKGKPACVVFHDDIYVYPAELWNDHREQLPVVKEFSTVRIVFLKRVCDKPACDLYSATIKGSGQLITNGSKSSAYAGTHAYSITREQIMAVLDGFRKADFLSMKDKYVYPQTDSEGYLLSIAYDGLRKEVYDYVGYKAGAPESLKRLEDQVEAVIRETAK